MRLSIGASSREWALAPLRPVLSDFHSSAAAVEGAAAAAGSTGAMAV
jgi:hypothetical protein